MKTDPTQAPHERAVVRLREIAAAHEGTFSDVCATALQEIADYLETLGWRPESEAPADRWLVTYLIGEARPTVAMLRVIDGDREWMAPDGRTTVTHHTYAAPSHFLAHPPLPKEGEAA